MNGDTEKFAFHEPGRLIRLGGGQTYLRYLEHQAGQETPVQFRLDGKGVQLDRRGPKETRLQFQEDQETITRYQTEYGVIHLAVTTFELTKEINFEERWGRLTTKYQLKNAGQVLGTYRIQLQFQA